MQKNLSVAELVQTIASPEKMQALAESVKAQLPVAANKAATSPAPAMLHGTAPLAKISTTELAHHGRVNAAQMAAARG